ncbi:MAG TPA: HTTM domain-containing protein, partial [Lacipirellulaceae bacterium]|nr:HTTM domain-containing protein [Lacipirellulaceae bacterium]
APATLSLIRLLAGGMLLYTHLVWSLDLASFVGPRGYIPVDFLQQVHTPPATAEVPDPSPMWSVWSVFFWIESTWLLWTVHIFALVVFFCLFAGLFSRVAAVLGFLLAVSYAHRVTPGAFFGLDKAHCMLALYLTLGPCGARYSLDRLWKLRRGKVADPPPSTAANVAIRLLQLHLCIVYLFSGLAKLGGASWRGGSAVWWAAASYEYQSLDLTWLAGFPLLVALLTHLTVAWEVFYCCLIWNRFARPIMLWIAVAVHGGIALCLGMITFGLAMIFANLAFLQPATVRAWIDPIASRVSLALVGRKVG